MKFNYDSYNRMEKPTVYLLSQDKLDKVPLSVYNLRIKLEVNDISEISFDIYEYENGKKNQYYDIIEALRTIYIPELGIHSTFQLTQPHEQKDGIKSTKSCRGRSLECQLTQKRVNYFIINMGTTGSMDDIVLYDDSYPDKSLLDLVLTNVPNWSVGFVEPTIANKRRSFDIDTQDVYSFLVKDVAEAYNCIFIFDTSNNKINVYDIDLLGQDTDIYISLNNLAKTIDISTDEDSIQTRVMVEGGDGLDIRDVNLGSDYIENLSYYNTPEWFGSEELCDKYNAYLDKVESYRDIYLAKIQEYLTLYSQYAHLNNKLPSNSDSVDWSEYGLKELETQKKSYYNITMSQEEAGHNDSSHINHEFYLINVKTRDDIVAEIAIRESEINAIVNNIDDVTSEISNISYDIKKDNNFTSDELSILSSLTIIGEYEKDGFIITDSMPEETKIQVKQELLETAINELSTISKPQYHFQTKMKNLFNIPEFKNSTKDFQLGNFIRLEIRPNYHVKLRLILIELTFENDSNISDLQVEFSTKIRARDTLNDFMALLSKSTKDSIDSVKRNLNDGLSGVTGDITDIKTIIDRKVDIDHLISKYVPIDNLASLYDKIDGIDVDDSSLLDKINELNKKLYNNATLNMSMKVSRDTPIVMDNTHWNTEEIRTKEGLGDLSVAARRILPYGRPDKLYNIYVDNGIVKIATRDYPDYDKKNWIDEFELGQGKSVAIAFDGDWKRHRKLWRLTTEENPWLFWVDDNNILWRQHWDNITTKTELDTEVEKVWAVRAWKNVNLIGRDQGLVVGYIKTDGTVWYKSYCQQVDYSYVWENSNQLTQFVGTAINLNMFITNDYRMGFIIEDNVGQVHWLLTSRNWGGMAVEQHTIRASAEALIDFSPITYYRGYEYERITVKADASPRLLFARQDNSITLVENVPITKINEEGAEYQDWGFAVRLRFNYEVIGTPVITLTDSEIQSTFSVLRIEKIEPGYEYLVLVDADIHEFGFNTVKADLNVEVTSFINAAGHNYDTIITSFMPVQLVPPIIPLPEVEAIWNE